MVRWVGEERVRVRLGEMSPIKGIGVGSVGQRVAEAVQRELGSLGPDEVVDRITVVARDRGPWRLQTRDRDAIGIAGYRGYRVEAVGVGRVLGGERARSRDPLPLIAPAPLQRLGALGDERRADNERKCELQANPPPIIEPFPSPTGF